MEKIQNHIMIHRIEEIVLENPDILPSQLKNKNVFGKELESFIRLNFTNLSDFTSVMFAQGIILLSRDFFKIKEIPQTFKFVCRRSNHFDIYFNFDKEVFLIYDFETQEGFLRKKNFGSRGKQNFGAKRYCIKGNQNSFWIFEYQLEEISTGYLSEKNRKKIFTDQMIYKHLSLFFPNKILPSFSSLRYHSSSIIKSIHSHFENRGGKNFFCDVVTKLGFEFNGQYYYNDKNQVLRTEYEFYLFSILDYNKLHNLYEPKNLPSLLPDFFLPNENLYIELLGLCGQKQYDSKTILKKEKYKQLNLKCLFIEPNHHDPFNSIFTIVNNFFDGELKKPDFFEYCQKYMVSYDGFIKKLKNICIELQNGKFNSSNDIGLVYGYTYNKFVLNSFGSWRMSVIKLLNEIPSKYVSTSNNYYTEETILLELEMCRNHLSLIPSKKLCEEIYKNGDYSVNVVLFLIREYGTKCFNKGGKYYGWIPYYMDREPVKNTKINFTESKTLLIIKDYNSGFGLVKISEKYGVSKSKIRSVLPDSIIRQQVKLTSEDVMLMHKMFNEEKMKPKDIMKFFNIKDVYSILNGRKWTSVHNEYHKMVR